MGLREIMAIAAIPVVAAVPGVASAARVEAINNEVTPIYQTIDAPSITAASTPSEQTYLSRWGKLAEEIQKVGEASLQGQELRDKNKGIKAYQEIAETRQNIDKDLVSNQQNISSPENKITISQAVKDSSGTGMSDNANANNDNTSKNTGMSMGV